MFKQTFKMFVESKELGVLRPRPLSPVERNKARAAASAAIIIHDTIKQQTVTSEEVKVLAERLKKFAKIKYVKHLLKSLETMLTAYEKYERSGEKVLARHAETKQNLKDMRAAFLSSNLKKTRDHAEKLNGHINDVDHHIDIGPRAHSHLKSNFLSQPSIFGTTRLLATISAADYDKIRALDFGSTLYTAVDFPTSKEDDFDYVLYFLTHLTTSPKPIRIDAEHDFRLHTKVKHSSNDKYDELSALMDKYLHNNSKDLIPKIMKLIQSIPSIRDANNKAKLKHSTVYRGVGFGEGEDLSDDEIIKQDRANRYVATSESKRAAKNFAMQKGHLESDEMRRSAHGYIIVYHVKPDAILFDTRVVDTVYGESEILIDATKAEVVEILEV